MCVAGLPQKKDCFVEFKNRSSFFILQLLLEYIFASLEFCCAKTNMGRGNRIICNFSYHPTDPSTPSS